MVEFMLSSIICHEFEKVVGKGQHKTGKAMHVGFHFSPDGEDQYRVMHLYLYAPGNYCYVAVQEERIDADSERHVGKMEMLCYHDSCWRDSVQRFIFQNRDKMSTLTAFGKLFDWYDVLSLTDEEQDYLSGLEHWQYSGLHRDEKGEFNKPNPFDKRGIWADKK